MGPMPGKDRLVPLDVKVVSEEKLDGYVRKKITFAVETGDRVPAWLLIPERRRRRPRPRSACTRPSPSARTNRSASASRKRSSRRCTS